MTYQTRQLITTIHMLPNISRSNGNQTKKIGQLIEYTWAIFFLKNHTQNLKCHEAFFVVLQGWGLPNCIKSKVLTTCSGLI